MDLERFDFGCELKYADGGDQAGLVTGYGSVFGKVDRGGDVVVKGAFRQSLREWRERKAAVPMLWDHDPKEPIGVWTEISEDDTGLKLKGELVLDVPRAQQVRALMMRGAVSGTSIGYKTRDHAIDRASGARLLKNVDLWEVSIVTFPMLPDAQASVKGAFDPNALERELRDEAKLSHREAKAAVSVFRKMVLRDGGRTEPATRDGADLLMSLRKAAETLRG